jgi:uncharacterized integral membrane protein
VKLVHWLVALPVALVLVGFAIANTETVTLGFWPLDQHLAGPLYLVVPAALVLGFIAGAFVAWINGGRWRREARRRQRRIEALERELQATQARLPRDHVTGLPARRD